MISMLVRVSRLPVGSSARNRIGSLTSARAIATRCCWPPESWAGRWCARSPRPTSASFARAVRRVSRRAVAVDERQLHVGDRAHPGQQVELLEDEADLRVPDPSQRVVVELRDVASFQEVAARRRGVEASQDAHERRLARARRPHDRDELAGVDRHRHAAERVHHVRAQPVVLRQVPRLDDGLSHHSIAGTLGSFSSGHLGERGLGQEQHARHRHRVLERDTDHLGRVDDPGLDQVDVLACARRRSRRLPVPLRISLTTTPPSTPEFSAICRVGASSARFRICRPVRSSPSHLPSSRSTASMARSSARPPPGHDAFRDRRLRGVDGVVERLLPALHLGFGRRADADHRHAARQLRQPLLELLAIVVAGGLLDLLADLLPCAPRSPSCRRARR